MAANDTIRGLTVRNMPMNKATPIVEIPTNPCPRHTIQVLVIILVPDRAIRKDTTVTGPGPPVAVAAY